MQDWQQRVIQEKAELDHRLERLIEFQASDRFLNLVPEQIKWLNRQGLVMELYSDILAERIAMFVAT